MRFLKRRILAANGFSPVVSQPEILHAYLLRNIRAGVIDFALRAEEQPAKLLVGGFDTDWQAVRAWNTRHNEKGQP